MELIIFWLICAVVAGLVASSKGRSGLGWFLLGLLISFFAIILVALLPSRKREVVSEYEARNQPTKDCPDCGEEILRVAKVCKHCGYRFARA